MVCPACTWVSVIKGHRSPTDDLKYNQVRQVLFCVKNVHNYTYVTNVTTLKLVIKHVSLLRQFLLAEIHHFYLKVSQIITTICYLNKLPFGKESNSCGTKQGEM